MTTVPEQDWHYSGTSWCSPLGTCLLSCCCPCVLYGRIRHRSKNAGNMVNYSTFNGDCLAFTGVSCLGVPFILSMISRGDMRAKYHLSGSTAKDCLCAFCCLHCDIAQQDKEVTYREAERRPLMTQPVTEAGMEYKPQEQQPQFHQG
ncbi:PLAC8-domain-containing protein [Pyrenochaeta sp. DS3sAY3a]|nr:PLAC8-domain-containing protein [Pyrenochaeta sp. DS3sAY3a]